MTDNSAVFVSRESFDKVVSEFPSLRIEQKAQWTKLEAAKGRKVYLPRSKTVRRVDISGFEAPPSMAMVPKQGVFGQVKQQLRLHGDEADILNRFRKLLSIMVELAAVEKAAKVKAVKAKSTQTAAPVKVDINSPDQIAKRMERIKAYAAAKGLPLSPKLTALADK